ncbi:metallophosphoesterase [bacterium]|nr:metallophosphoesterase [bacterium]
MTPGLAFTGLLASYIATETLSLGFERTIIRDQQLPAEFHNLRVVFVSDIHHGPFSNVSRLRRMVSKINRLQPDLVLFGGDYLTKYRSHQKLVSDYIELLGILQKIRPPSLGCYAVLGNHDYDFSIDFNRQQLQRAGIRLLHNQGVTLERGSAQIRLDGVGDMWFGHPDFALAHEHTDKKTFTILLSHQPNFIDRLTPQDGVNFVLAGHTHGSQITFFRYQPFVPHRIAAYDYQVGLVQTPQARMLVSPGIGNELPYFRFCSPPKAHLLIFKTEHQPNS